MSIWRSGLTAGFLALSLVLSACATPHLQGPQTPPLGFNGPRIEAGTLGRGSWVTTSVPAARVATPARARSAPDRARTAPNPRVRPAAPPGENRKCASTITSTSRPTASRTALCE